MNKGPVFYRVVLAASLMGLLVPGSTHAEAGHGSVSVTHQYVDYDRFRLGNGRTAYTGNVDSHSLTLNAAYEVTDSLGISVSLPYVARRYRGPYPHGLAGVDAEPGAEFLDDGSYNTGLQDWSIAVTYSTGWGERLVGGPVLDIQGPSNDYPTYGSAAVGKGLWQVGVGATVGAQFERSNNYWTLGYSYVFSEEVGGVDLDHHRFSAEFGRFLSPSLTGRVFLAGKYGGGLDFFCDTDGLVPRFDRCDRDDYPSFFDRRWYQHDQTMSGEFVHLGLGLDWAFAGSYQTSVSYVRGVWERNSYITSHAVSIGLTRFF